MVNERRETGELSLIFKVPCLWDLLIDWYLVSGLKVSTGSCTSLPPSSDEQAVFRPDNQPYFPCPGRHPQKMEWHLSPEMKRAIYFAETRISDLIRQHDVQTLEYAR